MASDDEEELCHSPQDSEPEDDDGSLRPMSYAFCLSKNYVQNWSNRAASRELYQNWKDGILTSFHLTQRDFLPEIEDTRNEIQIRLYHPHCTPSGARKLLGYILYKKRYGSIEMSNFQARLTSHDLDFGGTTKKDKNRLLAGEHGEGLKIAALVLRRKGFRVQLMASKFSFNFGFRGKCQSRIYCKLTPISPSTLPKKKENCQRNYVLGSSVNLISDPSKDVTVHITKGQGADGVKITPDEFKDWMRVVLDLNMPPAGYIIQTEHGDLILDRDRYKNQMYLKDILLSRPGSEGRKYRHGYNFLRGETDRERQSLASQEEEALIASKIWASAIRLQKKYIVARYTALLRDNWGCADVFRADKVVAKDTAIAIWEYLLTQGRGKFYYGLGEKEMNYETIVTGLRRKPVGLSKVLWDILRKYTLARTPDEERIHVFETSQLSTLQPNHFMRHIKRALAGYLALHPQTRDVTVKYVAGGNCDVNVLFNPP
ncbi:uncharacterized protein BO97DRAFT_466122 [Aspergillus homomorphus CBS 101889]|uniref:Uncharacterized protein n=1 Tax=Aspergillus homomorphus (strain CBS 101889) TaxID=1450537 RepID=A0A395I8B0_ASPHC|nr:hypothetical protein BO97DRAFT_466122 [Aspergillus homomorphus CBS 101889]RAL14394.1 hypothetical protein BO97DRAFT_466122 [Aspergillus homomorphus CBS 101889]